jgi:hypothetical protein
MGVVTNHQLGKHDDVNVLRLTGNDESGEPVNSGGNTRCGCSVSGGDNFLRVEEVDTEETNWVKGNKDKGENDSDVCWDKVVLGDLRATNGQAELNVSVYSPRLKGVMG